MCTEYMCTCVQCQNRFLQVMTEEEYDAIYGDYEADAEVLSAQQVTRNIKETKCLRLRQSNEVYFALEKDLGRA